MEGNTITVTLTVDNRKITLEGPEDFVSAEVRRFASPPPTLPSPIQEQNDRGSDTVRSERDLVAQKRPRNQTETVAVLGFFLTQNGQAEFTEADIRRAYIRAGVRPPKVVAQALRDARNKFDLIEPGTKRGTFRLSPHGDRTIRFDLPGTES
jgi:hypothetical protein